MKNIAKALLAIISIAGLAVATSEGIEVLSVDEGIEVLSITDNGVNWGIEVLAAQAPAGSMVMATMQVNGQTQIVDMAVLDANNMATVNFPTMQPGNHIHLIQNPMLMNCGTGGYSTVMELD